ncbi:hypothetical protein ACLB2K_024160 [Fragaria x ananassa]
MREEEERVPVEGVGTGTRVIDRKGFIQKTKTKICIPFILYLVLGGEFDRIGDTHLIRRSRDVEDEETKLSTPVRDHDLAGIENPPTNPVSPSSARFSFTEAPLLKARSQGGWGGRDEATNPVMYAAVAGIGNSRSEP